MQLTVVYCDVRVPITVFRWRLTSKISFLSLHFTVVCCGICVPDAIFRSKPAVKIRFLFQNDAVYYNVCVPITVLGWRLTCTFKFVLMRFAVVSACPTQSWQETHMEVHFLLVYWQCDTCVPITIMRSNPFWDPSFLSTMCSHAYPSSTSLRRTPVVRILGAFVWCGVWCLHVCLHVCRYLKMMSVVIILGVFVWCGVMSRCLNLYRMYFSHLLGMFSISCSFVFHLCFSVFFLIFLKFYIFWHSPMFLFLLMRVEFSYIYHIFLCPYTCAVFVNIHVHFLYCFHFFPIELSDLCVCLTSLCAEGHGRTAVSCVLQG